MRTLFAVIYLLLFLILGLPILGIEWIISKFNKQHTDLVQLRIVQWGFRCISFISGIKLTVIGEENVPKDEAVLYIGNHRSIFDIIVTYARCPRPTGYIAKKGVNKVPILRLWMKRLHCIFLNRDDIKEGLKDSDKRVEFFDDLKTAVSFAKKVTKENTICLLSPAASSYGYFKNFEERGKLFKQYVLDENV